MFLHLKGPDYYTKIFICGPLGKSDCLKMIGLPLALGRLIFDLGEGNRLSKGRDFQSLSRPGTLFKLLSNLGVVVIADILDTSHLNLDGFGFFRFELVDLVADRDPLDGDAGLAVLLLDQMLTDHGLGQLGGLSSNNLAQPFQGGRNVGLLNALGLFLLVFSLILARDSLAGFLDHVRVSSKPRPAHQALLGSLEISSVLTIQIATKTASTAPKHVRSGNLDAFTIIENPETFLDSIDKDHIVLVLLDLNNGLTGSVLPGLGLTGLNVDAFLVTVEVHLDHKVGGEDDFRRTGQDLDLLLLRVSLDILGQDSDRDVLGAVLEEQVVAVVQLVLIGLVIEGGNIAGFDPAGGRDLVLGQLLHDVVAGGVPHGDGEDASEGPGHPDVLDLVLASS